MKLVIKYRLNTKSYLINRLNLLYNLNSIAIIDFVGTLTANPALLIYLISSPILIIICLAIIS